MHNIEQWSFLAAETTSFANSKCQNPIIGEMNYYGFIEDIIKVDYWGVFRMVICKCCWYQEEEDPYGMTSRVNFNKSRHKSDPYVLASQVHQVFYVEDPITKSVQYVMKRLPRVWCDTEDQDLLEEENNLPDKHDSNLDFQIQNQSSEFSWFRDDIPKRQVPVSPT